MTANNQWIIRNSSKELFYHDVIFPQLDLADSLQNEWRIVILVYSALRWDQIKFQILKIKLSKGERVWFKDSKNILHEILAIRA